MKSLFSKMVLLAMVVLLTTSIRAEVVTEAMIGGGHKGNLFNDSNSTSDSYATLGLGLKYYLSSGTQFTAGTQYNKYANYGDLSNLNGNLSFIIIPTHENSTISLGLANYLQVRKFGSLYELYDQVNISIGINVNYHLSQWASLQSSVSYLNNSYTNSDFGSNRGFEFAAGINITVAGSNAFALGFDYSHPSFDQPKITRNNATYIFDYSQKNSEAFEATDVFVRYSRPFGKRTGFNFTTGHRQLYIENEYAVPGYSIDYLSPWSDLWEGFYISSKIKHFFPKQIILEASINYQDKNFVDVIEDDENNSGAFLIKSRSDKLTSLSLTISKSVSLHNGKILTPTVDFGWRQNNSTFLFYNYKDFFASISLKIVL